MQQLTTESMKNLKLFLNLLASKKKIVREVILSFQLA